jgi:hypothetical protein
MLPNDLKNASHKKLLQYLKLYPLSPFYMWKIALTNHKDKAINDAAKQLRLSLFLFLGIWVLIMLII